jgi:signal transduction histidine kinase
MTDRTAARVAGGLWLVALAFAISGGILQFLTRDVPVEYYGIRGFQGVFGLIIGGTGWLIAARRRRNPIGWVFVGAGLASAFQAFNSAYATYSFARHGGALPLTNLFVWLAVWVWVFIVGPMATYVLMLFPEGRLETRRQRALAVFAAVAIAVFAAVVAVTPGQSGEMPSGVLNPYGISKAVSDKLAPLMSLFLIAVVLSIAVLIARFRRSTGEIRQQMKWITFAGSFAVISIILSTLQLGTQAVDRSLAERAAAIAVIVSFGAIPVAAGIAILRYGLYEIDVVINKTIFYAVLAIFITLVYVGVVVGIGALVGSGANTGLSIAATAIVAVAIQPVRARAHRLANRMVFGKRSTPYEALSEFGARLSEGVQAEDVLPRLARLMTEATAADRASVWLAVGAELRPAGSFPPDAPLEPVALATDEVAIPGSDRVYPVRHEGDLLGALAVSAPPNDPLTASEERLLADLASQAGLLLRNARLIEELRASRVRLVAAQDVERRRIERNLHDGAQQQLVALAVNLKLLARVVDAPPEASEMIQRLQTDTTDALENLRDLARGIYPPLLAERGLVAALGSQATKASLPVTVEGDGVGRYQQETEAALYFCALEALQNVAKYAGATRATVRVSATNGRLAFAVTDDGAGFDVRAAKRGSGLTNMADRLEALGGRLDVVSQPGSGTTVTGWVTAWPVEPG